MVLKVYGALAAVMMMVLAPLVAASSFDGLYSAPTYPSDIDVSNKAIKSFEGPTLIPVKGQEISFEPMNAPRSMGFNKTEAMGNCSLNPPTLDGTLSPDEWKDAATYDIGLPGNDVHLLIMYNQTKIFMALDVLSDLTNNLQDPGAMQLINGKGDYFIISMDGENDGKITYGSIDSGGNDWPSTMPITIPGGNCTDRGAICHGGNARMAGFWEMNKANTSAMLYYWGPGPGPNMGTYEPYDFLYPGFSDHRTFEYSIPFNGTGDELNRSIGEKLGILVVVNDGSLNGGSGGIIAKMPSNVSAPSGPPWQEFILDGKPKVKMTPFAKNKILAGETLHFSDAGSTDPDGKTLSYAWDFDFDGTTFDNQSLSASVDHKFDVPGNFTVALRVTDPLGSFDTATGKVLVVQPEEPPVIFNTTPAQVSSIIESSQTTFRAEFKDPNMALLGERLDVQWAIDGKVVKKFNSFVNDSTSQLIKTNYTGPFSAGSYKIKIMVNDSYDALGLYTGGPKSVFYEWTLNVGNKNRPPVITKFLPDDLNTTVTDEATKINFNITTFDPDGDTVTAAWYLDGVLASGATGNSFDYLSTPNYNSAGAHSIRVQIKDAGSPPFYLNLTWNFTVTNIDRAPLIQSSIPEPGHLSIDEGTILQFSVSASDPDSDPLTYQWYLNDDPLDGETMLSYKFVTDYNMSSGQEYNIKLVVSDGTLTKELSWAVLVHDVDRPFTAIVKAPKDKDNYHLSTIVDFDASGTYDPDGDALTYLWSFGDGSTKPSMRTTHKYDKPGDYEVSVIIRSTHKDVVLTRQIYMNITIQAAIVNMVKVVPDLSQVKKDGTVNIVVTVANNGTMTANNLTVELTLDNGALISTQTKQSIDPSNTKGFSFQWKANRAGKHYFTAKVYTDDKADTLVPTATATSTVVDVIAPKTNPVANNMTWVLILVLLIIIILVLVLFIIARRMSKKKKQQELPGIEPTPVKTEPVAPFVEPVQPTQPVAPPPPPPPPPPPVQAPPTLAPPPVKAVPKPSSPPPVKAQAKSAPVEDISDDEVARLEAEFEAEEAKKKAAQAAAKAPPPMQPPSKPTAVPRPMPQGPPPKPIMVPSKPPVIPPPKPSTEPTVESSAKDVAIKRDSMSKSIAGEGLAVTDEMAQMAADAGLCPGCGGTVGAEDSHCTVCMQKLAVPGWLKKKRAEEAQAKAKKEAPAPKADNKCPSCGEETEPDFATCPSCGKKL